MYGKDKIVEYDKLLSLSSIFDNLTIVSPKELFEFIKHKDYSISMIKKTMPLINKYFPNAKIYLRYVEDAEYGEWDTVFFYILDSGDFEKNWGEYSRLITEFNRLKFPNNDVKLYFELSYITNEWFAFRE